MNWYKLFTFVALGASASVGMSASCFGQTPSQLFARGVGSARAQSGASYGGVSPVFVAPRVGTEGVVTSGSEYSAASSATKTAELSGEPLDERAHAEAVLADSQARAYRRSHTVKPIDAPMTLGSLKTKSTGGLQYPQSSNPYARRAGSQQYLQYAPSALQSNGTVQGNQYGRAGGSAVRNGAVIEAVTVPGSAPYNAALQGAFANPAATNGPAAPNFQQDEEVGFSTSGKATGLPTAPQLDPSFFTDPSAVAKPRPALPEAQPTQESVEESIPDFVDLDDSVDLSNATPDGDAEFQLPQNADVELTPLELDDPAEATIQPGLQNNDLTLEPADDVVEPADMPIASPEDVVEPFDANESQFISDPLESQESQSLNGQDALDLTGNDAVIDNVVLPPEDGANLQDAPIVESEPVLEPEPVVEPQDNVLPEETTDAVEQPDASDATQENFEDSAFPEDEAPSPVKPSVQMPEETTDASVINPEPQVLDPQGVVEAPSAPATPTPTFNPVPNAPNENQAPSQPTFPRQPPQNQANAQASGQSNMQPSCNPGSFGDAVYGFAANSYHGARGNGAYLPYAPANPGCVPGQFQLNPAGVAPAPTCAPTPYQYMGYPTAQQYGASAAPGLIAGAEWLWWSTEADNGLDVMREYYDDLPDLQAVGTGLRGWLGWRGVNGFDLIYTYAWFDQSDELAPEKLSNYYFNGGYTLDVKLENHDLELGRSLTRDNLFARAFIGFRWTSLTSEQRGHNSYMVHTPPSDLLGNELVLLDDGDIDGFPVTQAVLDEYELYEENVLARSRLNAYGLRLGAQLNLGLAGGLSLYGKGAGVLAVGDLKTRVEGFAYQEYITQEQKNTYFSPSLEAGAGLAWNLGQLQARAGYEFNYWFNAQKTLGQKSDFLAHGVSAGLSWNY
ncbi:MAG: Lpg1974 family pore-forming outer membrane protein [Planctomycetia bacterium]|nr:Lpg1974 family pore-forming outer membrane protein [Planctomycetia bacterium]